MDYDTDSDISDTCSENMDWIDDELMEDEFYNAFYNSPIESIQIVQMLFDDKCEKCYNISKSSYQLKTPGRFSSEELIPILRCQTQQGFNPFSILKFALEVDSSKINEFIENNNSKNLQEVSYTNDIIFKDSTKALESTTTIFILYSKKSVKQNKNKNRTTRSIHMKLNNANSANNANNTNNANSANNTNNINKKKFNKTRRKQITFE